MIPSSDIDFYGDTTRWFVARVININDPLQMGRVRIRIIGIHDNPQITEDYLPWAQVVIPVTEGASSGIGTNTGIKEQAQVFGVFLDGKNSQVPIVLGAMTKYEENIQEEVEQGNTQPSEARKSALVSGIHKNVQPPTEVDRIYLQGDTNAERCYNFLVTKEGLGLTPEQACGIIGNLCVESGAEINPQALNTTEGSFGIAQWNPAETAGDRFGKLRKFADSLNINVNSLYVQLLFIREEMIKESYLGLGELKRAKTAEDAALIFMRKYERPGYVREKDTKTGNLQIVIDETGNKKRLGQEERVAFAEEMYKKMST